jgi:beta-phosphoglucomutase
MGIAFDLEGTVVDVEAAHHNGHLAAAADFGLTIALEEAYDKLPHFIGGPREKVCEDLWKLLSPKIQQEVTIEDILARDKFHYTSLLATMPIKLRPGFLDFYKSVCSMGLSVTIGSLTAEKEAQTLLERSGLLDLFSIEKIVLREHVTHLKPAPGVFLKTAALMRVDPEDQLVFEDSPRGIEAALAAGSKAIGMPVVIRGATVAELIDAGAARIFFDWREINATELIENLGSGRAARCNRERKAEVLFTPV